MTRAERAALARRRQSTKAKRSYTTAPVPFRPLPMSERFWRDVEVIHVRCAKLAAYQPAARRDRGKGWA